jgi:uncharacterized membrane protein YecN with MAPEG domain
MTRRRAEITRTAHFDDCARSFRRDRLVQRMTTSVGSQYAGVCDARQGWISKSTVLLSRLGGGDDMKPPLIAAICCHPYAVLSLQVVRLRRRDRFGFGDGENAPFAARSSARAFCRIRVDNCADGSTLEISGLGATRIHMLMDSLLVARFLHPRHLCQAADVAI